MSGPGRLTEKGLRRGAASSRGEDPAPGGSAVLFPNPSNLTGDSGPRLCAMGRPRHLGGWSLPAPDVSFQGTDVPLWKAPCLLSLLSSLQQSEPPGGWGAALGSPLPVGGRQKRTYHELRELGLPPSFLSAQTAVGAGHSQPGLPLGREPARLRHKAVSPNPSRQSEILVLPTLTHSSDFVISSESGWEEGGMICPPHQRPG